MTLTVKGRSGGDVEAALEEALRVIRAGNTRGGDQSRDGGYRFEQRGGDDHERLTRAGWSYDGERWSRGDRRGLSYVEALELEDPA